MKDDKTSKFVKGVLKKLHINTSPKTTNLLIQIFKFVIVGGIATLIDWIVYYILYNFLKVNPLIANILSFSVSVIYNYSASVRWVFDVNKNKNKKKMFAEFMIFSVIGLIITELLLYLFINILSLHAMLSKVISTLIVMVFNFVTRKMFLE